MRKVLAALWIMLLCSSTSVAAQVSVGIGFPGVSIGINLPVYPELVPVPGYPVYYAPQVNTNYFFYDGMYWVYQRDNWYASSWYNGPWGLVAPEAVPLFVLRVPVRYYRRPPAYFRGWRSEAPPRWGEHWGNSWEQRHQRMGHVGSWLCARAGPAAYLSATIFGESISPRGAAAGASKPELPIPAARRRIATALSSTAGAKCARAPGAARSASGKQRPASRPARLEPTSFDPAGRSLAAARTVAAKWQRRSSEADLRPSAFSGARPDSPVTGTAATTSAWAAGTKGTGPEQTTTASPWTPAGITNIPASAAATTASGSSASAAGAKPGENTARQRTRTGIKAGPGERPRQERAARRGAQVRAALGRIVLPRHMTPLHGSFREAGVL